MDCVNLPKRYIVIWKKGVELSKQNNFIDMRDDDINQATRMVWYWFMEDPEAYCEAVSGAAYWYYCPSEIDKQRLAQWVAYRRPDIDVQSVKWEQIIVECFL